ncbi:MAG: hypothetical protein LIO46_07455 [Clostridiales bacterium]|nr:hypothetical protein [Clostridiales bacterium]
MAKTKGGNIVMGIVLSILGLLAVLILVYAGLHFYQPAAVQYQGAVNPYITEPGETMVAAHRSGGGIYPENTLMAFKSCVESETFETDIFEFDLQLTKDGKLVLLHDDTLDRTTNSEEQFGAKGVTVHEKTYEELRELNFGEHFEDEAGNTPYAGLRGDEIPDDLRVVSLEEVLNYLEGEQAYQYIIEIKDGGEVGYQGVDELYRILSERDMLDRVIFGTFNGEVSQYVDDNYPDLVRSAGIMEVVNFYFSCLVNRDLDPDDIKFQALQVPANQYVVVRMGTEKFINYAHRHNIAVQYWTINDEDEIARLSEIGADAIMSDVPDTAYRIINGAS